MRYFGLKANILCLLSVVAMTMLLKIGNAQANCTPGGLNRGGGVIEPSYLRSLLLALSEHAKVPGNLAMNSTAGKISLGVNERRIFDIQPSSYKVEVEIRTSYSNVRNSFGPETQISKFQFTTNPDCSDLSLISKSSDRAISIGPADAMLSTAAALAFTEYLKDPTVIPENRHSGGHRILIFTPHVCPASPAGSSIANVNVLRSHQAGSIVYRTSTFLTDVATQSITNSKVQAGRWLPVICH